MQKTIPILAILIVASIGLIHSASAVDLSQPECNALGKGYVDMSLANYTFVCGYPFNATVPYGNVIAWIDTDTHNNYHHSITSDNGTFNSDPTFFWEKTIINDNMFFVGHTYKFTDQLSNSIGYITVAPKGTLAQVTWISTNPQPVIDDSNHSTPLQLPPQSVGLPSNTNWVNPTNSTNSTSTNSTLQTVSTTNETAVNKTTTVVVVTAPSDDIKALNAKIDALSAKIDQMQTEQDSIFGSINQILKYFHII